MLFEAPLDCCLVVFRYSNLIHPKQNTVDAQERSSSLASSTPSEPTDSPTRTSFFNDSFFSKIKHSYSSQTLNKSSTNLSPTIDCFNKHQKGNSQPSNPKQLRFASFADCPALLGIPLTDLKMKSGLPEVITKTIKEIEKHLRDPDLYSAAHDQGKAEKILKKVPTKVSYLEKQKAPELTWFLKEIFRKLPQPIVPPDIAEKSFGKRTMKFCYTIRTLSRRKSWKKKV